MAAVAESTSKLPNSFLIENELDSAEQYAKLLWDALSVGAADIPAPFSVSHTHFHGPVQTQILQTGVDARASISQRGQRNQMYLAEMKKHLDVLRDVVDTELTDESEHRKAAKAIADVENELSSENPAGSKIKRILKPIGKWLGDRGNAAIDAAIGATANYILAGKP